LGKPLPGATNTVSEYNRGSPTKKTSEELENTKKLLAKKLNFKDTERSNWWKPDNDTQNSA